MPAGLPVAKGLALSAEGVWRRAVVERLTCDFAADLEAIARGIGLAHEDFAGHFARLHQLEADGLVPFDGAQVHISAQGGALARVVVAAFDTYLTASSAGNRHATV